MCKHDCHSTLHCLITHMSCVSFMSHISLSDPDLLIDVVILAEMYCTVWVVFK